MKLSFSSSWFFLVLATPFVVVVAKKKEKKTKSTKNKNKNGSKSASSSSSSVEQDLRSASDNTCVPASGTWGGKSFRGGNASHTPFETCFQNEYTKEECWSKSYYHTGIHHVWYKCFPTGEGWHFLNSGAATSTCGSPCQQFGSTDDDDFFTSYGGYGAMLSF